MKIKRATALVCAFDKTTPVVQNFLTRKIFACNGIAIDLLAQLDEWTDLESFMRSSSFAPESLARTLEQLIAHDAILVEGAPQAEHDEHYRRTWRWGPVAGLYQFSLRDQEFLEGEETREKMRQYAAESPSPPLLMSNEGLDVVDLPEIDAEDPLMSRLAARESRREYSGRAISLGTLGACLHAGNGLKRMEDCGDFGILPKTMSPSGGARNPFELYVYAQNVADLPAGTYHYSAAEHNLGLIESGSLPRPQELLANQTWANAASAIVFLAATFERAAWKYRQPLAYRVVLMESGYIAQNILLMAAHLGIAGAPTGALAETRIETLLKLTPVEQGVMFAIVLGAPAKPQGTDFEQVDPLSSPDDRRL